MQTSLRGRLGIMAAVLVAAGAAVGEEPSGVDGTPLEQVRQAMEAGRFSDAERLLRSHGIATEAPVVDELATEWEIMRRIRMDYALTPEEMLVKIGGSVADVTAADLERWRTEGQLQHRVIDGEVRYFRREPSNLLRFSKEARKRRLPADKPKPAGKKFDLPSHLAKLVKEAEQATTPEVHPVRHEVTYRLKVKDGHPRLRAGAKVRCWLPYPQEYRQQQQVRLTSASPAGYTVAPKDAPQRTIYFEQTVQAGEQSQGAEFEAQFEFVTAAYCPHLDPVRVKPYDRSSKLFHDYTSERAPHIIFTPEVRRIAEEVAGNEPNPLRRAEKLYRWICANIRYCAEMEYSTIANISDKALASRRGDCGVQGLLFITLCRAAGVPARWQSGWETLPNRWNMHDWAEFYVEPWGWLPADPSYGLQEHADPRVEGFYFGHLDAYRMIVNLDYARDLVPPKKSFRSEPNDFQRGEIEIDGHNLYFDEWDWTFEARTMPTAGGMEALEEAIDAVVPKGLQQGGMCGAVVAVGQRTKTGFETWEKAYGYLGTQPQAVRLTTDAVFDLASMTKPIATGTSLMILADRGRLNIDDRVGKYLPQFKTGAKEKVTIRHLMTHMSGERPYLSKEEQEQIRKAHGFPCPAATRECIRSLDLTHPPGEVMVYSCLNAILCAEIVEAVSGMPLDVFAAANIFQPLGMRETSFVPPEAFRLRTAPTTRAARGRGEGGFLQGQVHDPIAALQGGVSGNAGLFSTAADLHRFAQVLLNEGQIDDVRILRRETVRQMTSVQNPGAKNAKGQADRRGLLWDLYPPDTGVEALYAFGHTGYAGTAIRVYPQQGVYILALANRVHPDDSGKVGEFRRLLWQTVGEVLMGVRPDTKNID